MVVNTPKGGEDRYNYEKLMETIANVNLDVIKQGSEIEEMNKSQEKQNEKESTSEMKFQFEGETGVDKEEKVGSEAETFENVADIAKAAVTEAAAVTNEPEAETELSREEIEIAEALKKKLVELDEEVAKKLQEELEKEEEIQSAKDIELALDIAKKINEEYQRSLKHAVVKKVTKKATGQRQRKPSKTFLANQERRKMINFLKGVIGVPEGIFTGMSFGKLEELSQKEMAKLKGDFIQRVEVERKLKQRHDLNIQQPFPDSEEGTPIKEKTEAKQEETLAQQIGAIKRKKSIATKPKAKRSRTEEAEKESERREDEPPAEP
ncbi:hypothetical protein L6452_42257 [Arctium lappa]|uniref:Uncharacterized protein n=1 Tax=Arctium lappa TaxID=4217 RepID=A0ACB8XHR8_ARCLA|nr:hypothetical protein L6452_42257 [Arctium lappa]